MGTTRTDRPRCRACGYPLDGLESGPCPECSTYFDWNEPDSIATGPLRDEWRLWYPGVLLSIGIGVLLFATLGAAGATGMGIWYGVPMSMGALLGYRVRARWTVLVLLAAVVSTGTIFTLVTMNWAGTFCGLALGLVLVGPMLVGVAIGAALRKILKAARYSQGKYLPIILALALPTVWTLLERGGHRGYTEIGVTTRRVIVGEPEDVWTQLMFFEDVGSRPPLLMRIALPRPIRTEGRMASVGDRRVCVYTAGRLTKEITSVTPNRELAFRVVEQEFEPSAVLTGGSFRLEPAGDGRTTLTLETRYIPVHAPRLVWRLAEIVGVRTLHTHVINGVELAVAEALRDRE